MIGASRQKLRTSDGLRVRIIQLRSGLVGFAAHSMTVGATRYVDVRGMATPDGRVFRLTGRDAGGNTHTQLTGAVPASLTAALVAAAPTRAS